MNRRLISAAMAVLVLMSFTSCGFIGRLRPENTTVSVTTEETAKETASETAATTEETTTEQTTSKEATAPTGTATPLASQITMVDMSLAEFVGLGDLNVEMTGYSCGTDDTDITEAWSAISQYYGV